MILEPEFLFRAWLFFACLVYLIVSAILAIRIKMGVSRNNIKFPEDPFSIDPRVTFRYIKYLYGIETEKLVDKALLWMFRVLFVAIMLVFIVYIANSIIFHRP